MKPINLVEMANNEELIKTGAKPKLPIKIAGLAEQNLYVYQIPLELLYYNNENGRISSAISRLDKELVPSYDTENPEYNQQIERMIIEDNPSALNKTKKSIERSGQKVFGYVLSDGRVIDGNRRLTSLRQLSEETGNTYYFEAVILPINYDSKASRSEIKRLELAIQMGTEEREAYDPVDLSVDVFRTIRSDRLMSEQDYAKEANMRLRDVKNRIMAVEMMHDFFEFINANNHAYHIIKDAKLYNPLAELAKHLNKLFPNKGPRYEESKEASFAMLTKILHTGGDMVREYRDYFDTVLKTSVSGEFVDKVEDSVEELRDALDSQQIKTVTDLKTVIEEATPSIREINVAFTQARNKTNRGKNVDNFINQIREAKEMFEDIRQGNGLTGALNYSNFSQDQLIEIRQYLIQTNILTKELIEIYEQEL